MQKHTSPKPAGVKSKPRRRTVATATTNRHEASFPIVGIGASAGGLDAFNELLKALPADTGMGFVLVQHLDPHHESALVQLLARSTAMPVREAANDLLVEPNCVYVIPPNTCMAITGGVLKLTSRTTDRGLPRSIDFFFESLSASQRERAIGVVLSGTASDGTHGLELIKAEGGMTFAQDHSAKYDSMPRSAIASGCVDFILSPKKIAEELARIAQHPLVRSAPGKGTIPPSASPEAEAEAGAPVGLSQSASPEPDGFTQILLQLRRHCGVDFSLYKSSTIHRRIARRVILTKQETLGQYAEFLAGNTLELDALYSDVLICVTSFFRNPEAFEIVQRKIIPKLLAQCQHEEALRIWVLGCSTGQEAYSLAMAFAECTADIPSPPRIQIFATDLNEAVLGKARAGLYPKSIVSDITLERLKRFFIEEKSGYRVSKSLRDQVVFARQNVMSDPPFSRIDLITCRNVLIYLEAELQKKILPAFHYALKPGGFLFLGTSESIGSFTNLFEPADKKQKIFSKKAARTPALRRPMSGEPSKAPVRVDVQNSLWRPARLEARREEGMRGEPNAQHEADRVAASQFAPPGVLINAQGEVLQFRGSTGAYLEQPSGRATLDVLKMARDGLMLPLRTAINKARRENKPVRREILPVRQTGGTRAVILHVIPLRNLQEPCFLVLFEDLRAPAIEPREANIERTSPVTSRELARTAALEVELSETRDFLQSIQEQNESANEELQASSEEFQSANEELQSINEELETSKEELESVNEELTTINDEMLSRNGELSRLNADLHNLELSSHTAILLLAQDLTIRRFTPTAELIFNLLPADVGRAFNNIRHNLKMPDLGEVLREVLATVRVCEREVQDEEGHWYALRVRPYFGDENKIDGVVLVLSDINELKRSEQEIKASRDYAHATLRTMPVPFLILRADLRVDSASDAFYETFGVNPAESEGRLIYELGNRQWDIPKLRELLEEILPRKRSFNGYEVTHEFESLGRRNMLLNARRLETEAGAPERILLAIEDITARQQADAAVRESEERYRILFSAVPVAVFVCDQNGIIQQCNELAVKLWGRAPKIGVETHCSSLRLFLPDGSVLLDEQRPIVEVLRTGRPVVNIELHIERPGGLRVPVLANVAALRNIQGEITGAITCFIDIHDRKRAEEALHVAMGEIERSSRAKDDFLAALSHELRTPLSPVLMTATALEGDPSIAPELREQFGMMRRNIELEARLIDDLLDLTRISRGKLQITPVAADIHQLLHYTAEIVRSDGLGKQVRIIFALEATHHHAQADPARLQQVFWNLLKNALKFTPTGGTVTVRTRNDAEGWLLISIEDTGIGIGPEALPHIFNAFEQGDVTNQHRYGGLGLGLAISHAIVAVHGGWIRVESEGAGRGATFIVNLACVKAPAVAKNLIARKAGAARPLRLLVVEDHEATRTVLARLLSRHGHRVTTTATIKEALAAFTAELFDAVISDLGLPDGSGLELMREVQLLRPVPGIALSGYGMDEDLRRTKEAGFFAHLVKPVNLEQLQYLLDQIGRPV